MNGLEGMVTEFIFSQFIAFLMFIALVHDKILRKKDQLLEKRKINRRL